MAGKTDHDKSRTRRVGLAADRAARWERVAFVVGLVVLWWLGSLMEKSLEQEKLVGPKRDLRFAGSYEHRMSGHLPLADELKFNAALDLRRQRGARELSLKSLGVDPRKFRNNSRVSQFNDYFKAAITTQVPALPAAHEIDIESMIYANKDLNAVAREDDPPPFPFKPQYRDWDQQRASYVAANPGCNMTEQGHPSIMVVTLSAPKRCAMTGGDFVLLQHMKNKMDYCHRHGFKLWYSLAPLFPGVFDSFWAKVPVIRNAMVSHPEAEWIWWLDADALITDMSFVPPLGSYPQSTVFVVHGNHSGVYEERSWEELSTGSVLIRNNQAGLDFVDSWAAFGPSGPVRDRWTRLFWRYIARFPPLGTPLYRACDQSALIFLLTVSKERQKWSNAFHVESEYALNGYWVPIIDKLQSGRRGERSDTNFPFVTHFSACRICDPSWNWFSKDHCTKSSLRAFRFGDDQVLLDYGFKHRSSTSSLKKFIRFTDLLQQDAAQSTADAANADKAEPDGAKPEEAGSGEAKPEEGEAEGEKPDGGGGDAAESDGQDGAGATINSDEIFPDHRQPILEDPDLDPSENSAGEEGGSGAGSEESQTQPQQQEGEQEQQEHVAAAAVEVGGEELSSGKPAVEKVGEWDGELTPDPGVAAGSGALNSLAVCVIGGVRSVFEFTGQSMIKTFFKVYSPADVFVNCNFDEHSVKIPLLLARVQKFGTARFGPAAAAIKLQAMRFSPFIPTDESKYHVEKLSKFVSLGGIQGVLQQFKLIEGCWDLIVAHEKKRTLRYEWVIKVRPDFYWNNPPPALSTLPIDKITIPDGRDIGGLNDQFAIIGRRWGEWGMMRLTHLNEAIEAFGPLVAPEGMSGEHIWKGAIVAGKVPLNRLSFPYCIAAFRPLQNYWPTRFENEETKTCSSFVYSITSTGTLNGQYCVPCEPCLSPEKTTEVLQSYPSNHPYYPGANVKGIIICDVNTMPEFSSLHDAFLETVPQDIAFDAMAVLKRMGSLEKCMEGVEEVIATTNRWLGGSAQKLCVRALLGSPNRERIDASTSYFKLEEKPAFSVFKYRDKTSSALFVVDPSTLVPRELRRMFRVRSLENFEEIDTLRKSDTASAYLYLPFDMFHLLEGKTRHDFAFCQIFTKIRKLRSSLQIIEKKRFWRGVGMALESCQSIDEHNLACSFFSVHYCL